MSIKILDKEDYITSIKIIANLEQIIAELNDFKEYDAYIITAFDLNDHIDPAITLIDELVKKLNQRSEDLIQEVVANGFIYSRLNPSISLGPDKSLLRLHLPDGI